MEKQWSSNKLITPESSRMPPFGPLEPKALGGYTSPVTTPLGNTVKSASMPGLLCCSTLTPVNWQWAGLSFVLVLCLDFFFLLFLFEIGSYTIASTGLEYTAILPQPCKCWDYRH